MMFDEEYDDEGHGEEEGPMGAPVHDLMVGRLPLLCFYPYVDAACQPVPQPTKSPIAEGSGMEKGRGSVGQCGPVWLGVNYLGLRLHVPQLS